MSGIDAPGIMGWLLLGVLLAVLVGLAAVSWWLFRRRRRDEAREEAAQELEESMRRLGLGDVWQAPLFQGDVFGVRGKVDDFDVRAELWERSSRDFFRLSVYFPRSIHQEFRLRMRRRTGLEYLWRMGRIEVGDRRFDDRFHVYCRQNREKGIDKVLAPAVRGRLVSIGERVDGIKLGDHSLYVFVDRQLEPPVIERIIRDTLSTAKELFNRAMEIGPSRLTRNTEYEMASVDVLGREATQEVETGGFPEGTSQIDINDGEDGEDGRAGLGDKRGRREADRKIVETQGLRWTHRLQAVDGETDSAGEAPPESESESESPRSSADSVDDESGEETSGSSPSSSEDPSGPASGESSEESDR